jgi:hypothetical protein
MKCALRPGGRLGIIGLFRDATFADLVWSAAAFPVSRCLVMALYAALDQN